MKDVERDKQNREKYKMITGREAPRDFNFDKFRQEVEMKQIEAPLYSAYNKVMGKQETSEDQEAKQFSEALMLHSSAFGGELKEYNPNEAAAQITNPMTTLAKDYSTKYSQMVENSIQETTRKLALKKAEEALKEEQMKQEQER